MEGKEANMPTYEYHCADCQKTFTASLTIVEHEKTPSPACPGCGSKNTAQHIASATVITSKKS
jgi:putative FmdB family regulatory protein